MPRTNGYTVSFAFAGAVALAASRYQWPTRWLLSGTPVLSLVLMLGAAGGSLQFLPLWAILATLNLAYMIAATSWLLYGLLAAVIYPTIFIVSIVQFDFAGRLVRKSLRKAIRQLQFVHDTIALFDIPALEIDVDVDGLMVVRALTISLSSLKVVAHGIEVGIKLSNDMELAISTERVDIRLFRGITISDCFANLKGGEYEMTFGELPDEKDEDGDALMVEATPILQAAGARPKMVKMKSQMAGGKDMQDSAAKAGWKSMTTLSPDDRTAREEFDRMLKHIKETNAIHQFRQELDLDSRTDLRAAICSKLHNTPTVPHPPQRSIRVTTLQNLSRPGTRRFMHRLPMLLRLLLNPISYLHPVSITSITAVGSGKWISHMLKRHLFKEYSESSKELRRLETRVLSWLADANFAVELNDITGLASVPFISNFDITALLRFSDVVAYRSLVNEVALEQIVRLGGADATFTIPSFLLPHHEHLLPPIPSPDDKEELHAEAQGAEGKPKEVQAERRLEQAEKDEANVKISAHVQLPACFSQDLLNFIAALVKATKVVEMEKEPGALDAKLSGLKDFGQALTKSMKDGMKKTVVDGVISDKWIAKMVGKVTRQLETAQGDVGYTGDIPVQLAKYRLPEGHPELSKLLA